MKKSHSLTLDCRSLGDAILRVRVYLYGVLCILTRRSMEEEEVIYTLETDCVLVSR